MEDFHCKIQSGPSLFKSFRISKYGGKMKHVTKKVHPSVVDGAAENNVYVPRAVIWCGDGIKKHVACRPRPAASTGIALPISLILALLLFVEPGCLRGADLACPTIPLGKHT